MDKTFINEPWFGLTGQFKLLSNPGVDVTTSNLGIEHGDGNIIDLATKENRNTLVRVAAW